MRFSLQDVKKSIQRRNGELFVSLHFLRPGELHAEIAQLIAYYERLLGQPQRQFSLDDARACVGDYRLAHCLIATLSHWYQWRQRDWQAVLQTLMVDASAADLASPIQLRLALYSYVNEHYQGFLDAQRRPAALQAFAALYQLTVSDLEALLALDSEDEALLVRDTPEAPEPQAVTILYNQWVFEAALFNASSVYFVIDCEAFAKLSSAQAVTGIGAVIKRLCYFARLLGVYYDLAYLPSLQADMAPTLLTLTLYGPQEVTGAPQHYGLRLARLCRMLLQYAIPKTEASQAKKGGRSAFSAALVEAAATVHFLQRSYQFAIGPDILRFTASPSPAANEQSATPTLFDSSIEESFAHAFGALAASQGADGWQLEREPEPLLLKQSIFIPDFALTRNRRRIYVEILGFWTPAYRERKIQKLQQLQERDDLLLAIPVEAKDAFATIAHAFPIVYYDGQLSATEILHMLRSRYDDFAARLAQIDVAAMRDRVRLEGLLPERICYEVLHCYRRSELARAAELVVTDDIVWIAGIGVYHTLWLAGLKQEVVAWMRAGHTLALSEVLKEIRLRRPVLAACEAATIEALLDMWPEISITRSSIFDAVVALADTPREEAEAAPALLMPVKESRKPAREKRTTSKKHHAQETTQSDLWGI